MRIAVLGGTFDPIHNGHLAAARSVYSTFRTDEVRFVPAFSAPHKQGQASTSVFHRFAMVALATSSFTTFQVSPIEVDALEKRYTVDTLEQMHAERPGSEFFFIMGTDMYRDFESWKDYQRLFKLAHLVVVHRPGFAFRGELAPHRIIREHEHVAVPDKPGVFYLPFVEHPISSTAIREARHRGDDASAWVPPIVWNYIEKHKLYS